MPYHILRSAKQSAVDETVEYALGLDLDPITPWSDEASARRAARFLNVRVKDGVWDVDDETWLCARCKSDDVKDCNEVPCDRQDGKPLAWHCRNCGHTWTK